MGQQQNDTIRIHATGEEKGAITGQDLGGRTWTLRRMGGQKRSKEDDRKQEVRNGFQQIFASAEKLPFLAVMLASYCIGSQEKYRLALPAAQAYNVMHTQGADFQNAVRKFMQALEQGGWLLFQ
jgi:hypothetical protein